MMLLFFFFYYYYIIILVILLPRRVSCCDNVQCSMVVCIPCGVNHEDGGHTFLAQTHMYCIIKYFQKQIHSVLYMRKCSWSLLLRTAVWHGPALDITILSQRLSTTPSHVLVSFMGFSLRTFLLLHKAVLSV